MKVMLVSVVLMVEMITTATSVEDTVEVVSFRKSRKTQNGPVMCALDVANETTSSSSLQDCSLSCARDVTCTGFNTKNPLTCDVYNYKPRIIASISACNNYQVSYNLYRHILYRKATIGYYFTTY